MNNPDEKFVLTQEFNISRLKEISGFYEQLVRNNFSFIINRFNNNPAYPWIDTKYNLIHRKNFAPNDPVRGLDTVYCWIQGRALEALSVYAKRLSYKKEQNAELIESIHEILKTVTRNLKQARDKNGGRLYFTMNTDGDFFKFDENFKPITIKLESDGPYNFSDMFCTRGMLCAAEELDDDELIEYSRQYCQDVYNSLHNNFKNDQYTFPGQSKQKDLGSARSFGPSMIYLATACLLFEMNPSKENAKTGMGLIDYIFDKYCNLEGKISGVDKFAIFEYIDNGNKPYIINGKLISDPGHALEFVGLSLKFCKQVMQNPGMETQIIYKIRQYLEILPHILEVNFKNGFNENIGGIYKRVDLLSGDVIDGYMPWWSLPETMRAAIQCYNINTDDQLRQTAKVIFTKCHNAFISNYIVNDEYDLAYQTLDRSGKPADIIPAVPDLDPGYHTCLSLMDCLRNIQKL